MVRNSSSSCPFLWSISSSDNLCFCCFKVTDLLSVFLTLGTDTFALGTVTFATDLALTGLVLGFEADLEWFENFNEDIDFLVTFYFTSDTFLGFELYDKV